MSSPGNIRLTVLGPLRIEVDGAPVPLAGKLKHRLLSRLALHPDRGVSTDVLIDALWGDDAPRTAKQSLHVHISHIRDRLRTVGAERLITTTLDGLYLLGTERVVIDAVLFEELIDQGIAALQVENLRSARDQLRDAMSMWGDPFESLADDYGAMAQRQRLASVHERGADAYTEVLIDLGETDEATTLLRTAVASEPLREQPYEQLMRIYLTSGERARALEVYERAAQVFDSQLNVAPSPNLRRLHDSVTGPATAPRRSPTTPPPLPKHSPNHAASVLNWDTGLEIDIGQSAMLEVPVQSDAAPFVEAVRASAALSGRRVAHGRILQGATSPLSPIFELAGFDAEPGTSRSPQLRAQLFDRISHRLIQQHFVVPILLLEGTENASALLLEYLSHALGRPGPPPFTVLLLGSDLPDLELPGPLQAAMEQRATLELTTARATPIESAVFDQAERTVLMLLSCASLPAPTELIARASGLRPADMAATVDRLGARRTVVSDADGRLSLSRAADTMEQLGAEHEERSSAHKALADALDHGDSASDPRRTVARARHLMRCLDRVDWGEASAALRQSVDYLESLGAYEDIVSLCSSGGDPASWPADEHTLALLVALGRAQMRLGRTDLGRHTLERCLELARATGQGHWFAEALRALFEERATQTLDASARDLIDEALGQLEDEASETRVQLLTDMANSWYFTDVDQAALWADRALGLARNGSPSTLARALTGVIQAKLLPGNAAERLELALEAQHWARRAESTETLVLALTYEVNALMELGELRRAGPPLRYAEALAAEVQVPRFRWWAAAWTALLDFALGDLTKAEEGFIGAYELWPTKSSFDPFECLASQIGALRLVQGRGAELLPVLTDLTGPDAQVEYLAPAALAFAQAGMTDEADELLDRLLTPQGIAGRHDIVRPFALALAAEAAFENGASRHAHQLATMLAPLAQVHTTLNVWGGGGFYWGSLRHGYGLALALDGCSEDARRELHRAASEQAAAGSALFADRSRRVLRTLTH